MTTPGTFGAHIYGTECQRHQDNARRAIQTAKAHLDALAAQIGKGPSPALSYDARQLNACAAETWAEVQAFLALHDVRFLVECGDEPAKEASDDRDQAHRDHRGSAASRHSG